MNLKDLVEAVSSETNIPAGNVRKVSIAVLKKFAHLIDNQDDFVSPVITLKSYTAPAKPATEATPARPERKLARIAIRPQKKSTD